MAVFDGLFGIVEGQAKAYFVAEACYFTKTHRWGW